MTVGDYLINLMPYIIYAVTPLCALVAVLVTFGGLNRSSELTAMKATGISLYRVVTPVLVIAAMIAVSLFLFDEFYLPGCEPQAGGAARRDQEQAGADVSAAGTRVDLGTGRTHGRAGADLLLPVLRQQQGCVREPFGVRVGAGDVCAATKDLCVLGAMGRA